MAVDTDARIDKLLVKNLLLSYLQLPANQRSNAIRVIGSLLGFSDEDYLKIGSESGALPKLMKWVRSTVSSLPSGPPKDVLLSSNNNNKTFTELLLAFLEEESSPRSPIKLPIDYYTPDIVHPTNIRKQVNATSPDEMYPVGKMPTCFTSLSNTPESDNNSSLSDQKPVFYML
uniref:SJCHGC04377 protein n=1 Tax=Schistosoma japonicum TaxID=6182 RepID=Q5DHB7_SCHJA|nr:SJCHGC04377 protein [Schistosoma japonicum]